MRLNTRTVAAPGVIRIDLQDGLGAMLDECDAGLLERRWTAMRLACGQAYVMRVEVAPDTGRQRMVLMHREILQAPKGMRVDHINHNGLDNRRCNIRLASASQNNANMLKATGGTSRFKGVAWHRAIKGSKKWQARITKEGRRMSLGTFLEEADAARAYDAAARDLFGPYAALNFPGPGELAAIREVAP